MLFFLFINWITVIRDVARIMLRGVQAKATRDWVWEGLCPSPENKYFHFSRLKKLYTPIEGQSPLSACLSMLLTVMMDS